MDNFAFLLPASMIIFGICFLVVAYHGSRPAGLWGIGYIGSALSFIVPIVPLPVQIVAISAEILCVVSYYCFGSALLLRFNQNLYARTRIAFGIASLLALAYVIIIQQSLRNELVLSDLVCGVLFAFPIVLCVRRARRLVDVALLVAASLTVVSNLSRTVLLAIMVSPGAELTSFAASDYNYMMQATVGILGMLLAVTALAAGAYDVILKYRNAAECDPLTGLLNRRGFERGMLGFDDGAILDGAVIACDIDHFKQVNDSSGHAAGDKVIAHLAGLLTRRLPGDAVAARFGGEEFVVYLPRMTLAEAAVLSQSIRLEFAAHDWLPLGVRRQITASFGVAQPARSDHLVHDAIGRADAALYAAKAAGRNKVMLEGQRSFNAAELRLISVA